MTFKAASKGPVVLYLRAIVMRDTRTLLATVAGCAVAALIATYQFSVLASFLSAANVAARYVDGQVWVMAHGVPAFDFAYAIERDYRGSLQRFFPGATSREVVSGFGLWNAPSGAKSTLAVVGVEDYPLHRRSFVFDRSDASQLEIDPGVSIAQAPVLPEIGLTRFVEAYPTDELATFLGSPYVVMHLSDARRALQLDAQYVTFLVIDTPNSDRLSQQIDVAQAHFPELSILHRDDFYQRSAIYWLVKTGAGAAIALSSILAALIMLLFLVSGISRFAQRYHEDFLTLIGLGYDTRYIGTVLAVVALSFALLAMVVASASLPAVIVMTEAIVPWVEYQAVSILFGVILALLAAFTAYRGARNQVRSLNLEEVFRS